MSQIKFADKFKNRKEAKQVYYKLVNKQYIFY